MIIGMEYSDFLELARSSIQESIYVGNGSFGSYRENVETFKTEHPDIIDKYELTESELFFMFMMLTQNYDEIQQCASSGKGSQFAKECVRLYDSFLSKVPRSKSDMFYRVDQYQRIENFINNSTYDCNHYLTASTICPDFKNYQTEVKFVICRRLIGETKAHEVFKICNANNEFQVNFERNTKFEIDYVDKKDKTVRLKEL